MCDQQRLRPACAYAQTDQSLCWSHKYCMTVKLLTEPHLRFLSLKGGYTGSSESTNVKVPHCWKSRVTLNYFLVYLVLIRLYYPKSERIFYTTSVEIQRLLHCSQIFVSLPVALFFKGDSNPNYKYVLPERAL